MDDTGQCCNIRIAPTRRSKCVCELFARALHEQAAHPTSVRDRHTLQGSRVLALVMKSPRAVLDAINKRLLRVTGRITLAPRRRIADREELSGQRPCRPEGGAKIR